jgi:hypothetical protein
MLNVLFKLTFFYIADTVRNEALIGRFNSRYVRN